MKFEYNFINYNSEELHKKVDEHLKQYFPNKEFRFSAILDVVNNETIYELKCTNSITIEHKVQLVFYAFLWKLCELPDKEFILFNIKTGERFELKGTFEQINFIIVTLLKGKYDEREKKNEDDFLAENIKIMNTMTSVHLMDSIYKSICEYDN